MADANPFQGMFCNSPFEYCYVDGVGDAYLCCPGAVPTIVGNLVDSAWDGVWNSPVSQQVRASIHEGTFHFCKSEHCPYYELGIRLSPPEKQLDPIYKRITSEKTTHMQRGPREVVIAYDPTCNLSCPYCRLQHISASGTAFDKARIIHERVWESALGDCTKLTIAGDGDPFASRLYRKALQEYDASKYPQMRIHLVTNGLMLTPQMWESVAAAHGAIYWINVSINAATPETFAINQRGGDWEKLLQNLEFISGIRRRNEIECFTVSFIVQANNFREMRAFVELGRRYKVDKINFVHLMEGAFDTRAYPLHAIHRPQHPQHAELVSIVKHPFFDARDIGLANIGQFLPSRRRRRSVGANVLRQLADLPNGGNGNSNGTQLDKLAHHLALDEAQTQQMRGLVESAKQRIVEIFCTAGIDGTRSPMNYFLDRLEQGADQAEAAEDAFRKYPMKILHPDTNLSHGRTVSRLDLETRTALIGLLTPAQQVSFAQVDLGPLINFDTGSDPMTARIGDEMLRRMRPAQSGMPKIAAWPALARELGLDQDAAREVQARIDALKRENLSVLLLTNGDGEAPAEHLADQLLAGVENPIEEFIRLITSTKPVGRDTTYAACINEAEAAAAVDLSRWLTTAQIHGLRAQFPEGLAKIETGVDPLGEFLSNRRDSVLTV